MEELEATVGKLATRLKNEQIVGAEGRGLLLKIEKDVDELRDSVRGVQERMLAVQEQMLSVQEQMLIMQKQVRAITAFDDMVGGMTPKLVGEVGKSGSRHA